MQFPVFPHDFTNTLFQLKTLERDRAAVHCQDLVNTMTRLGLTTTRFAAGDWIGEASFKPLDVETYYNNVQTPIFSFHAYGIDNNDRYAEGFMLFDSEYSHTLQVSVAQDFSHQPDDDEIHSYPRYQNHHMQSIFGSGCSIVNVVPRMNVEDVVRKIQYVSSSGSFQRAGATAVVGSIALLMHDAMHQHAGMTHAFELAKVSIPRFNFGTYGDSECVESYVESVRAWLGLYQELLLYRGVETNSCLHLL